MPNHLGQRSNTLTLQSRPEVARDVFARLCSEGTAWQGPNDILRDLHLTADELAGALGVGVDDIGRGELTRSLSEDVVSRIESLASLYKHLVETFSSSEAIPLWMRTDSRYLGGRTPADVLRDGRIDRVEAALEALDYGAFV